MPDNTINEPTADEATPTAGPSRPPAAWSSEQLVRLENEWRRLQRSFAYHPHVRVAPIDGDPPHEYQINYRLRTLVMPQGEALAFADQLTVHVWLPPAFPHAAPLVRPMQPAFHPNMVLEAIDLVPPWTPHTTVADVVTSVGRMLALQVYDPNNVWNDAAMQWIVDNPEHLPVDPEADFSADANGDPLARICRFGAQTLAQIRGQLGQMCDALVGDGPPTSPEVRQMAARTRLALGLFLEDDVPDDLRGPASQLDDAARELSESADAWGVLRRQHAVAKAAQDVAQQLGQTRQVIAAELRQIEGLAREAEPQSLRDRLKRIPSLSVLQAEQGRLQGLLDHFNAELADAHARLREIEILPAVGAASQGLVGKRIEQAKTAAADAVLQSRQVLAAEISYSEPVQKRSQQRQDGLQRLMGWREYVDLREKAADLARRVTEWGAAGVEACFIENDSGAFGPYCFEQELDLGATAVAARSLGPTQIDVLDAQTGETRVRSEDGTAVVQVQDAESGQKFPTTIRTTARCDELAVQLAYLADETQRLFDHTQGRVDAGDSWLTRCDEGLNAESARAELASNQSRSQERLRALCADLQALCPYKQRLATYLLLERLKRSIPKLRGRLADAQKAFDQAGRKIEEIAAASSRDPDTGQLQIPAKLATSYKEQVKQRDQARRDVPRYKRLLELEAEALANRLQSPELLGVASVPAMRALSPLPAELADLAPTMAAGALRQVLGEVCQALGKEIDMPRTQEEDRAQAEAQAAARQAQAQAAATDGGAAAEEEADSDDIGWQASPPASTH